MNDLPPPGWQLPPRTGWPTWSVSKRIVVVVSVAALVGAGIGAIKVYERANPEFTVSVLGCSADERIATVEFAITNELSLRQDARVSVDYFGQSGERLGSDTVEVSDIRPDETVRKSRGTRLDAPAASITCEIDRIYSVDG